MKVVKIIDCNPETELNITMFGHSISAGQPTPTEGYTEGAIDLNKHLIRHPRSTYFVKVSGDSMVDAGISNGGILIIDCAVEPCHGDVVIARLDGDLTVKRYEIRPEGEYLVAENPSYPDILITPESDFQILGVAIHVIHSLSSSHGMNL